MPLSAPRLHHTTTTDVAHPLNVLHELLIVLFDSYRCLVGVFGSLVHLPLCLQQWVHSLLFVLVENLVTEVDRLGADCALFVGNFAPVGPVLIFVEVDLNGDVFYLCLHVDLLAYPVLDLHLAQLSVGITTYCCASESSSLSA